MAASLRGQTAPCCSPTAPRRALAFSRRSCGSAAGQARTSRFHFRATSEQQQEQQQGSQQAPPPPRRPRQQEGAVSELFTPQAILNYDGHIERAKEFMEQAEASLKVRSSRTGGSRCRAWPPCAAPAIQASRPSHASHLLQDVDSQISEMRQDMEVPAWAVGFLRWARGFHCQTLEEARKRHASLVAKRERYVAGLRQLERELQEQPPMFPPDEGTADWVVLAGYNWAIGQEDDSSEGLQKVLRESLEQANSPSEWRRAPPHIYMYCTHACPLCAMRCVGQHTHRDGYRAGCWREGPTPAPAPDAVPRACLPCPQTACCG